ncbi:hypothetical protein H6G83_34710 [Anabaena azotica FACHB-119]|uniref:Uncharacterized protein n=1 Tax=Anabaena azotica FACHB-119 TaxID=947527 RepID=A0ABR8DF94_9NOST|nr:hypothetical protein [Anabaena azotica FACHB-119]
MLIMRLDQKCVSIVISSLCSQRIEQAIALLWTAAIAFTTRQIEKLQIDYLLSVVSCFG